VFENSVIGFFNIRCALQGYFAQLYFCFINQNLEFVVVLVLGVKFIGIQKSVCWE
jgi:hypothetical protein